MLKSAELKDKPIATDYLGVDLVAVTGTFYTDPNDARFRLSLNTAENMREQDIPYIVVDSSPEEHAEWVAKEHKERGATVVHAEVGGIATQRIQGAVYAANHGAEKVLSSEPEKTLMPFFSEEISRGLDSYDVLVIGRTLKRLRIVCLQYNNVLNA